MIPIDLSGKVVLITGASRGIGRVGALLLGRAGASVALNYHRNREGAEEVARQLPPERTILLEGDIGDPSRARAMVDETVQRFGRLDVLVNNAAIFADNQFEREDYEGWQAGWQKTLDVNILGPANLFWAALPQMRSQGGGKVINVASRAAFRGETELADYGASKAALVNLTKSIARRCGQYNVVATCIAPGWIETDMAAADLAIRRHEITSEIPLGRIGSPLDVAGVILFLASPFGDYLNGATIDVNGGSYVR